MMFENQYRTHTCAGIDESVIGSEVRVAGWVENIRDHGGVQFLDLRDHYGVVQVVVYDEALLHGVTRECAVTVSGPVVKRSEETYNDKIATGTVEVKAASLTVLGRVREPLPFEIPASTETKEEVRLKYRFLDLRNRKVHDNIVLRSQVISHLRRKMTELGFLELQTPILSASSPEGARDYLIPSRKFHGKFYALPQAPQIFKQLLMVSGFDKYFQVAPCFRDEDARADRSPGEFYQLDFEMAFATQEDVFRVAEDVLYDVFSTFSDKPVSPAPFKRIPYAECMLKYGTDKPDLRNPLEIIDISDLFVSTDFAPFRGKTVRAINVPGCASRSKSFFENMLKFATDIGMKGLGYVKVTDDMSFQGPIDKFLTAADRASSPAACSTSSPTPRNWPPASPAKSAPRWPAGWISSTRTGTSCALWWTSPCTSGTRRADSSSSPTTPSPCPRAGCRPWRRWIPWISSPTSTTSCATAWSCPPARCATTIWT